MGVWIEISLLFEKSVLPVESLPAWECGLKYTMNYQKFYPTTVTPCVGVWIEIPGTLLCHIARVTPCVGVWVEIPQKLRPNGKDTSLPVSERETKFLMYIMELNEAGLY